MTSHGTECSECMAHKVARAYITRWGLHLVIYCRPDWVVGAGMKYIIWGRGIKNGQVLEVKRNKSDNFASFGGVSRKAEVADLM